MTARVGDYLWVDAGAGLPVRARLAASFHNGAALFVVLHTFLPLPSGAWVGGELCLLQDGDGAYREAVEGHVCTVRVEAHH